MSERTPQDVLRELRRAVDELSGGGLIRRVDVLALLDKAIAEAPASPPKSRGALAYLLAALDMSADDPGKRSAVKDARQRARTVLESAAPDTLSEKPGLDVERLARAMSTVESSGPIYGDVNPLTKARYVAAEYARLGSTDSEGR